PIGLVGIDFVHPFQGLLNKKQERFRVFLVLFYTRFVSKPPIGLVGIDFALLRPSPSKTPEQETRTLSRFPCFVSHPLCEQAPYRV
ncbi:MAG: hypothetical protein IJY98_03220, partial [Bacteroidaceae bacterium]|nr:hypothetical protein [Bacteroidaceae bacterium]